MMLKKKDTSLPSSSRRENPPPEILRAKAIGCMPSIFHFVSKHQHGRKFLTFGKKQEKKKNWPQNKAKETAMVMQAPRCEDAGKKKEGDEKKGARRLSSDAPRSPTIPPEIRCSKPLNPSGNLRSTPPASFTQEETQSATEKKRNLMGALEKCDRDLKAIKKIIEVLRTAKIDDTHKTFAKIDDTHKIDAFTKMNNGHSPFTCAGHFTTRNDNVGQVSVQQNPPARKKPGENKAIDFCCFNNVKTESMLETAASPCWRSKAMIDSVNEACRDIDQGEKREVGIIGLALHDYVWRDLVDETVTELGFPMYSLPSYSCKRRLSF